MNKKAMVLPAAKATGIRLVSLPEDFDEREAYRFVTGLITRVEEADPDYEWEDIALLLEEHGFEAIDFILGPGLD
jgi:hypothetical protein